MRRGSSTPCWTGAGTSSARAPQAASKLKPGDRLCFYQADVGVIAEATVASVPERKFIKFNPDLERYPWAFQVTKVRYFEPIVIDMALRSRLDAYKALADAFAGTGSQPRAEAREHAGIGWYV